MTRKTADVLLTKIVPIIRATVPRIVKPTGCEDTEELVQDTIATAAQMLDSVEKAGKKPVPRSIAFYSIQRAKSGRRANQCSKNDVLGPVFQTANENAVAYMDAPLSADGEGADMHSLVADRRESPDETALRRMDWESLMQSLDRREKMILGDVASGNPAKETARKLGVSSGRVTQLKAELARRVKAFMGEGILADISTSPQWRRDLMAVHESKGSKYAARFGDDEPEAA